MLKGREGSNEVTCTSVDEVAIAGVLDADPFPTIPLPFSLIICATFEDIT